LVIAGEKVAAVTGAETRCNKLIGEVLHSYLPADLR
jgi:hypothetical protein